LFASARKKVDIKLIGNKKIIKISFESLNNCLKALRFITEKLSEKTVITSASNFGVLNGSEVHQGDITTVIIAKDTSAAFSML
jgi:hypothetical protein